MFAREEGICCCCCCCCLESLVQYRSDFLYSFVRVFHFAVMIGVTCTFVCKLSVSLFLLVCLHFCIMLWRMF